MRTQALTLLLTLLGPGARAALPTLDEVRAAVEAALGDGRVGEAVARCGDLPRAELDRPLRERCADAAVSLGDRLASSGQMSLARSRWEQALDWNPALADRPDFMERLTLPVWRVSEDDAPPEDTPTADEREPEPEPDSDEETPDAPSDAEAEPAPPADNRSGSPRGEGAVGLGSGWYDGLLGLTASVLIDGTFEALASAGLVYPTFDLRLRYHPVEGALTPTVGLGLFIPFTDSASDRGVVKPLEALYGLGDAFHVDAGATFFFDFGLAVSAMVSFVTTIDQDHPDAVVFHPQWSTHVGLHF